MAKKSHTKKLFKKKRSLFSKLFNAVKGIDMFGKDIVLTYKGDDKYRTHIGGCASVVVGFIIIVYVVYLFMVLFRKMDTTVSTTSIIEDIFSDVQVHQPGENKFDFAISFVADGVDYMQDPTAFSVYMNQVEQEWDSTTSESASFDRNYSSVEFEKCGDSGFSYDNQAEIKRIGVDEFYCPTRDNYTVAGSFFAKTFHYLELKVRKCLGDGCRDEAEIDEIMKESRFSLALVNTVVDFKDYVNPIKYIIDDGQYWELTPGIRKKTDIFIRYNEAEFEDNYVQLGFEDEQSFYQVADWSDRFEAESSKGDVLSIYFRVDKVTDKYERQIFSLGELVGQAGGFYGALLSIGGLFIMIFSERLFAAAILRRIYQIDTWQEREKLGKKEPRRQNYEQRMDQEEIQNEGGEHLRPKKVPVTKSEVFHANALDQIKQFNKLPAQSQSPELQSEILSKCEKSLRERRVFKYGYMSILHYLLC